MHVCGQFFFFFFSALDLGGLLTLTISWRILVRFHLFSSSSSVPSTLAGLLILTVGVSPTRVFVSWCDVCPHSAVFRQGLTGNKAQSGLEECCS